VWQDYEEGLERYMPVLMAMARIYWDRENYPMVSRTHTHVYRDRDR
jgi:tetratricopeptide repeat protein 30